LKATVIKPRNFAIPSSGPENTLAVAVQRIDVVRGKTVADPIRLKCAVLVMGNSAAQGGNPQRPIGIDEQILSYAALQPRNGPSLISREAVSIESDQAPASG
jgi:hypothetical protein